MPGQLGIAAGSVDDLQNRAIRASRSGFETAFESFLRRVGRDAQACDPFAVFTTWGNRARGSHFRNLGLTPSLPAPIIRAVDPARSSGTMQQKNSARRPVRRHWTPCETRAGTGLNRKRSIRKNRNLFLHLDRAKATVLRIQDPGDLFRRL